MIPKRSRSTRGEESRWRTTHELQALRETVAVLRAGANSLAIDNAILKIENQHLRVRAHTASAKRS